MTGFLTRIQIWKLDLPIGRSVEDACVVWFVRSSSIPRDAFAFRGREDGKRVGATRRRRRRKAWFQMTSEKPRFQNTACRRRTQRNAKSDRLCRLERVRARGPLYSVKLFWNPRGRGTDNGTRRTRPSDFPLRALSRRRPKDIFQTARETTILSPNAYAGPRPQSDAAPKNKRAVCFVKLFKNPRDAGTDNGTRCVPVVPSDGRARPDIECAAVPRDRQRVRLWKSAEALENPVGTRPLWPYVPRRARAWRPIYVLARRRVRRDMYDKYDV